MRNAPRLTRAGSPEHLTREHYAAEPPDPDHASHSRRHVTLMTSCRSVADLPASGLNFLAV